MAQNTLAWISNNSWPIVLSLLAAAISLYAFARAQRETARRKADALRAEDRAATARDQAEQLGAAIRELSLERERLRDELARASMHLTAREPDGPRVEGPSELPPIESSLLDDLRARTCTLFAGSGLSAQADHLPWLERVSRLVDHFASRDGEPVWTPVRQKLAEGNLNEATDLLSARVSRQELLNALARSYQTPGPLPSPIATLANLPFVRVLTANWDTVAEDLFTARRPTVLLPNRSERFAASFRENAFVVLKLYGDLSHPASVSFSADEYRRSIEDNPEFFKFVSSIYSSNTILFIGVSLAGIEDFVGALRLRGNPNRLHHALVPWQRDIAVQQERFLGRFGIKLLVYTPTPGFPEVQRWIEALHSEYIQRPAPPLEPAEINQQVVTRLQLENIGSFVQFDHELNPGWNLLLGNNGLGKSTLLKAIAMGFCGADPKAARAAHGLLRSGAQRAVIRLWLGNDLYETRLVRDGQEVRVESDRFTPFQSGTLVALGFPPLRGISTNNPRGPREVVSPNPVIEDVLPLLLGGADTRFDDLKQWLVNVHSRVDSSAATEEERWQARRMRDTFFRIMDELSPGLQIKPGSVDTNTWDVKVLTQDGDIPIDLLSQGMVSLLAWVGALLERMFEIYPHSPAPEREPGLLLVDELSAHMHPEWEYAMVPLIRKNFPKLQVIATTHSALVVANSKMGEVFHLHRDGKDVKIEKLTIDFAGLRADQVLTGPAFQLPTTVDPTTAKLREEYADLLAKNRTPQQDARFQELGRILDLRIPKPHEREEGREAMALLEQWMIERIRTKPAEQRKKVMKEAELYFAQLDAGTKTNEPS
jgi:predicted ATPase